MIERRVKVTFYRWAGACGPFRVKTPCGECELTADVIDDALENELRDLAVHVEVRDWLSVWWRPLAAGGWHAPIVMVDDRVVSQGRVLNRGMFQEAVVRTHARKVPLRGNHVYTKPGCPHCERAMVYLDAANIRYQRHDVVEEPVALYAMLERVKPLIPRGAPIAVPQIWIDGHHIGGADALSELLDRRIPARLDRGRSSLSPGDGLDHGTYT
jgi:glutaredoxin